MRSGTYRPYRPSNGTEGDIFMADWCEKCALFNPDDEDKACMINLRSLAHSIDDPEYPAEWQYSDGGVPMCTAFTTETDDAIPRCPDTADMFDEKEKQ